MKNKSMRLLLASAVTVLGLSGFTSCDNDSDSETTSVALTDLVLGYEVNGTGGLAGYLDIISIRFCPIGTYYTPDTSVDGDNKIVYTSQTNYGKFEIEGNSFFQDDYYAWVDTEDAGTPGRLEVGATYVSDVLGDPNAWTVTSIEQIDCIIEDR